MSKSKKIGSNIKYELTGIILLILSAITLGKFGSIGNILVFITKIIAGNWGFLLPIFSGFLSLLLIIRRKLLKLNSRFYGIVIIFIIILIISHLNLYAKLQTENVEELNILSYTYGILLEDRLSEESNDLGGGLIGAICLVVSLYLFDINGTKLVLLGSLLAGILLITKITIGDILFKIVNNIKVIFKKAILKLEKLHSKKSNEKSSKNTDTNNNLENNNDHQIIGMFEHQTILENEKNNLDYNNDNYNDVSVTKFVETDESIDIKERETNNKLNINLKNNDKYEYPKLNLLANRQTKNKNDNNINTNIKKLEDTLKSFGVDAKVINYSKGPSVTRYELQPAAGVKVSRIISLTDDIALALAAKDIRMEAPIPGKSAIGIEVPNTIISIIGLKDVIDSKEFKNPSSKLTIALGKDLTGKSIVADLSKMPHLLVAGSTGSGKSVCINGIITSILYRAKPDEVKFFMIDPKMVELNVYNGIPHLVTPVVTDPRQASYLLKKVVEEMERRYKLFANIKARDIERYNYLVSIQKSEGNNNLEVLPQIVVIVDELADLMMVAPNDVEDAICRIAQMARAAGIHLIIATQRPSVDVITGIIKANIPTRIAFSVASQTDSRTILDMGGAEKLLGRGDMLFFPVGAAKPLRVQGAYISEDEIEQIVSFIKQQKTAEYDENLINLETNTITSQSQNELDEFYDQAVELVVEAGQASVSYLQRKLKIGYARAARLIDSMEEQGVIGQFEGSKPREVFLTKDQLAQQKQNN